MRTRIARRAGPVAVGAGVIAALSLLTLPGQGFSWPVWGCGVSALLFVRLRVAGPAAGPVVSSPRLRHVVLLVLAALVVAVTLEILAPRCSPAPVDNRRCILVPTDCLPQRSSP